MSTTNTAELKRNLLDDDGENQAVRSFLIVYGGANSPTIGQMRDHLARSGFDGFWPAWVQQVFPTTHLTKSGAQDWIRHLLSLEGRTAAHGEPSKAAYECDGQCFKCECGRMGGESSKPVSTLDRMLNSGDPDNDPLMQAGSAEQVSEDDAFEKVWPEIYKHGVDKGWRGIAWAAWQAAAERKDET